MLTYEQAVRKLTDYRPTVYDAVTDHPEVRGELSHRAHTGLELYYECYKLICPDVRPGSALLDIGAYPGTFLRLCNNVFFSDKQLRLTGTGLILPEDEENFRGKASMRPEVQFVRSPLGFSEFFASEGISFVECDLEICSGGGEARAIGGFDVITCAEVIEHLHTPYKLINTIRNNLVPGGVCVIETNNIQNINGIIKLLCTGSSNLDFELVDRYSPDSYTSKRPHTRFYSLGELAHLLTKAGLVIEAAYSFHWSVPGYAVRQGRLKTLLRNKAQHLAAKLLPGKASHIIIKARKPK